LINGESRGGKGTRREGTGVDGKGRGKEKRQDRIEGRHKVGEKNSPSFPGFSSHKLTFP